QSSCGSRYRAGAEPQRRQGFYGSALPFAFIIDDQHERRVRILRGMGGKYAAAVLDDRKREGRTASFFAADGNITTKELRHVLGKHQSEAGAPELARNALVTLAEGLKQSRHLLPGHADTSVCDGEAQARDAVAHQAFAADVDVAVLGELAGVGQEIEQ